MMYTLGAKMYTLGAKCFPEPPNICYLKKCSISLDIATIKISISYDYGYIQKL